MKNSVKLILVLAIIFLLLGGAGFLIHKGNQIPKNPPATVGNTAGNLYNGGLFCENDGIVYFSNTYDNGALYSMTPNESDLKKVNKYSSKYINAAVDYLYYYMNSAGSSSIAGFGGSMLGVYRSKKNGDKITCLDKTPSGTISLAGNTLFYEHYTNAKKEGMTLYRIDIDKQNKEQVIKEIVDPSCVRNGTIYYAGTNGDHSLYTLDVSTGSINELYAGSIWNPLVMQDGNTVYYMNVGDSYSLHRLTLSSGEDEKLTEDRVDLFNVTTNYIFYQKNDAAEPALMRMKLDGSEPELVMSGNFCNLNATSAYVYFQPFGNDITIYKTPAMGPVAVSEFGAARDAAKANQK